MHCRDCMLTAADEMSVRQVSSELSSLLRNSRNDLPSRHVVPRFLEAQQAQRQRSHVRFQLLTVFSDFQWIARTPASCVSCSVALPCLHESLPIRPRAGARLSRGGL